MELLLIKNNFVIYKTNEGNICAVQIDQQAKDILDWYVHNVPANQE